MVPLVPLSVRSFLCQFAGSLLLDNEISSFPNVQSLFVGRDARGGCFVDGQNGYEQESISVLDHMSLQRGLKVKS